MSPEMPGSVPERRSRAVRTRDHGRLESGRHRDEGRDPEVAHCESSAAAAGAAIVSDWPGPSADPIRAVPPPSRVTKHAKRRPSGDQRGEEAEPPPNVSLVSVPRTRSREDLAVGARARDALEQDAIAVGRKRGVGDESR